LLVCAVGAVSASFALSFAASCSRPFCFSSVFVSSPPRPRSTLFPYTTLFRSLACCAGLGYLAHSVGSVDHRHDDLGVSLRTPSAAASPGPFQPTRDPKCRRTTTKARLTRATRWLCRRDRKSVV